MTIKRRQWRRFLALVAVVLWGSTLLASPEGQATIADVSNFATGGVTFMYDKEEVLIPYSL